MMDVEVNLDPEEKKEFGESLQQRTGWVQSKIGCGNIFFMACYTKYSKEDDPATTETAAQILSVVLDTVDEMLLRRKVGRIVFKK